MFQPAQPGQLHQGGPRIISSGHPEGPWMRNRQKFTGRLMRPPVVRKTIDFNSSLANYLANRTWALPSALIRHDIVHGSADYLRAFEPVWAHRDNPAQAYLTKYVSTSVNKTRYPVFACTWTREGRRLYTGSNSGEITLWDGAQFNFITLLQAHDDAIRSMAWSNNDMWLVTGDAGGVIKYWQSNMNNYKAVRGHKEDIRDISFCPSDLKFATASDDQTIGLWDFETCRLERSLLGHGFDVKSVHWHPTKSLVLSGSKDNLVKLWDPRAGDEVASLRSHKNQVSRVRWNPNGLWFVSAGRDHLAKVWDIRAMKEFQVYKDHNAEVTALNWHPVVEYVFASGSSDGNVKFFHTDHDTAQAEITGAHDDIVWDLQWHPLGHLLATCSNDCFTRFWTRNRPGDDMRDKYNVNQLPEDQRYDVLIEIAEAARMNTTGRFARLPKVLEGIDLPPEDELEEGFDDEQRGQLAANIPGLGSGVQDIGKPVAIPSSFSASALPAASSTSAASAVAPLAPASWDDVDQPTTAVVKTEPPTVPASTPSSSSSSSRLSSSSSSSSSTSSRRSHSPRRRRYSRSRSRSPHGHHNRRSRSPRRRRSRSPMPPGPPGPSAGGYRPRDHPRHLEGGYPPFPSHPHHAQRHRHHPGGPPPGSLEPPHGSPHGPPHGYPPGSPPFDRGPYQPPVGPPSNHPQHHPHFHYHHHPHELRTAGPGFAGPPPPPPHLGGNVKQEWGPPGAPPPVRGGGGGYPPPMPPRR